MKKAGFTMIELVFVVVILGVLTAVAVPYFSLTREDACYSKLRADLSETQTIMTREYTKKFLQGKSMTTTELQNIAKTLEANRSDKCYFSVGNISVANGVINGTLTANVGKNTLSMSIKNENNIAGASIGATGQPVITCDLNNTMCQMITGKVKK